MKDEAELIEEITAEITAISAEIKKRASRQRQRLTAALDIIESIREAEKRGDARYSRNPYDGEEAVVIDYDWWQALVADAQALIAQHKEG